MEHEGKKITYGTSSGEVWQDVEADKVDEGKALELTDWKNPAFRWEQWG